MMMFIVLLFRWQIYFYFLTIHLIILQLPPHTPHTQTHALYVANPYLAFTAAPRLPQHKFGFALSRRHLFTCVYSHSFGSLNQTTSQKCTTKHITPTQPATIDGCVPHNLLYIVPKIRLPTFFPSFSYMERRRHIDPHYRGEIYNYSSRCARDNAHALRCLCASLLYTGYGLRACALRCVPSGHKNARGLSL